MLGNLRYLLAATFGAALAYFLDPDRGRRRRNMARDRLPAIVRRASQQLARRARYAGSTAQGISQKVSHVRRDGDPAPDDQTLAHKVESEIFRDPDVPKGKININAENGVVVLRGEMDHPEDINALEKKVRGVPGVQEVENLLHLPNTMAQNSLSD